MEPVAALILFAVFLGVLSQRVTGMGFGLVSGPFLVLAFGGGVAALVKGASALV